MIQLHDVTKTYNAGKQNEFQALQHIDLEIAQNEVSVIVGPSGSGKTTLLSILGCMSKPTAGRVWLSGKEITSLPERFAAQTRNQTFGFIFQKYNLIKGISVLENTMIPAYPLGLKYREVRDRAVSLLERFEIVSKANERIENLSGGEQQRTAIARALINGPSFIIADEPTAHLDSNLVYKLLDIFAQFKKEGKTVVIASHDPLIFDSQVVDRVITMRGGRIERDDR